MYGSGTFYASSPDKQSVHNNMTIRVEDPSSPQKIYMSNDNTTWTEIYWGDLSLYDPRPKYLKME